MSLFLEIEKMVRKLLIERADFYNEKWEIICSPGAYKRLHREMQSFACTLSDDAKIVYINPLGLKFPIVVDNILPDGEIRIMRKE